MNEQEAEELALERLSSLFTAPEIPGLIRRKAGLFGGGTALEWIMEGRIDEVVQRYDLAINAIL